MREKALIVGKKIPRGTDISQALSDLHNTIASLAGKSSKKYHFSLLNRTLETGKIHKFQSLLRVLQTRIAWYPPGMEYRIYITIILALFDPQEANFFIYKAN